MKEEERTFVGPPRIKGTNVEHPVDQGGGNHRSALLKRFGDLSLEPGKSSPGMFLVQLDGAVLTGNKGDFADTELGGLANDLLLFLSFEQAEQEYQGSERSLVGRKGVGGD